MQTTIYKSAFLKFKKRKKKPTTLSWAYLILPVSAVSSPTRLGPPLPFFPEPQSSSRPATPLPPWQAG